ncbi:hypothetical protein HAX54_021763, partial [Datura stramonium]|nr:hypothetical protein [Datura stramonium]
DGTIGSSRPCWQSQSPAPSRLVPARPLPTITGVDEPLILRRTIIFSVNSGNEEILFWIRLTLRFGTKAHMSQVFMAPKFQPTRSIARREVTIPRFDEGDESLENGSSSDSLGYNLDKESRNDATSRAQKNTFRKATAPREEDTSREALKVKIVDLELPKYTNIERGYKHYGLKWMSNAPGTYFPNMVHEFYATYATTLDNMCKKVLTDGQPPWLTNPREKIYKSTLIFTEKFWWAIMRVQLFPTRGDNMLGEDRAFLLSISLPFPCLVIGLCKEAHVPILVGIDVEIVANKKHDFDKSKDEAKHDLQLHKSVPEVFEPNGKLVRMTGDHTATSGAYTGVEVAFIVAHSSHPRHLRCSTRSLRPSWKKGPSRYPPVVAREAIPGVPDFSLQGVIGGGALHGITKQIA